MKTEQIISVIEKIEKIDLQQRIDKIPREERWRCISRDTAEFLSILIRMCSLKKIVEVGTSVGYSTIWLGLAADSTNGKVTSFELNQTRVDLALKHIAEADLSNRVQVHQQDPLRNQENIPDKIDLVFLDCEKEDYVQFFHLFYPRLKDGGIIVADNIVSHFAETKEYVELVRNHEHCNSVLLSSMGKGLEITYKRKENENKEIDWNILIR